MAFVPDAPSAGGFVPDKPAAAAPPMQTEKDRRAAILTEGNPIIETGRTMGQNLGAKVLSGYSGLAGALLPGAQGQGARWQAATEQALSHEPTSPTAKTNLKIAGLPFEYLFEKPAGYLGEKVGEKSPLAGALLKGGIEAAPMALGFRKSSGPTPKQAGAENVSKQGFSLTPSDAGAGIVPRVVEGLAGEPKLAKNISEKNAAVAAEKIVADLGLPKGTQLDLKTLQKFIKDQGAGYEAVRNLGSVEATPAYYAALDALAKKYANAQKDFPELARNDVLAVTNAAKRNVFDASSAVDLIGQLRESANQAYASSNTGMGKVYRGVADALEAELEKHAAAVGKPEVAKGFTDARTKIAQAYQAIKALEEHGLVNPQAYATALEKNKPLTGGAREVAEAAKENPRSFQRPTGGNQLAPTWSDILLGAMGGTGAAVAHGAASGGYAIPIIAARPTARYGLSSRPYQRFQNEVPPILAPATVNALQYGAGTRPAPQKNQ